ncbi:FGGY-family carbohydrate kinase [Thermithiobacillus plumbiphilus]|uniref:FGGY-family carbohydrate kinase n=1 Tax=Thermithiobacillus plumbiphilus TaxID=1729899 RepID=A0ABU9D6Z4_9PROT
MLFLGVDVGTSGIRALVIDEGGTIRAQARAPLPEVQGEHGWREQDPQCWLDALEGCMAGLGQQLGPAMQSIQALALDGTSATLVVTDQSGQPLRPALMYNDQRARDEAREIAQALPASGALASASSSLAKLLWLTRHEAHVARQIIHVQHQADWIAATLTGCRGESDAANLLKLGLDPETLNWPTEVRKLLEAAGLDPAILPRARPSGEIIDQISPAWARRLGLPASLQLVHGTTDSLAALIAAGVRQAGQAATSLGSTLVLKLAAKLPLNQPAEGIYSHRLNALWLPGGASNSGGAALLKHFSVAEMARLTSSLQPHQPSGQLCYPLTRPGERFPLNAPSFSGSEISESDPSKRFQMLLEGLCYIEAWGYARLQEGGTTMREVFSLGGGASNGPWMQMRANVLDRPVIVPQCAEAALGAAMLAASPGFGTLEQAQSALDQPSQSFIPDPAAVAHFRPMTEAFITQFAEDAGAG